MYLASWEVRRRRPRKVHYFTSLFLLAFADELPAFCQQMARAWKQVLVDSQGRQPHVSLPARQVVQTQTLPVPVSLRVHPIHPRATQVRNQIAMHLPIPNSPYFPTKRISLHTAGAAIKKADLLMVLKVSLIQLFYCHITLFKPLAPACQANTHTQNTNVNGLQSSFRSVHIGTTRNITNICFNNVQNRCICNESDNKYRSA
jgi:hypothetical protein